MKVRDLWSCFVSKTQDNHRIIFVIDVSCINYYTSRHGNSSRSSNCRNLRVKGMKRLNNRKNKQRIGQRSREIRILVKRRPEDTEEEMQIRP